MMSLALAGPDSLIKSAAMSAANAYVKVGTQFAERKFTKLDVMLPAAVLRASANLTDIVPALPPDIRDADMVILKVKRVDVRAERESLR